MNAEYLRERNRFTLAAAGLLALAEICSPLTLIRSDGMQVLGGALTFVSGLGVLVAYGAACKYFAMARGHSAEWCVLPLCIVTIVVGFLAYFFLDSASGVHLGTIGWHIMPLIVFAIGAAPLYLLPDRTRRVDRPKNTP